MTSNCLSLHIAVIGYNFTVKLIAYLNKLPKAKFLKNGYAEK